MVKERAQSASPIQFVSYDQAYAPGFEDMQRRVPSLEKLAPLIGFRPTTELKVIVDEVIAYFRTRGAESTGLGLAFAGSVRASQLSLISG
jgi:UDP-glucose 4-epimerase